MKSKSVESSSLEVFVTLFSSGPLKVIFSVHESTKSLEESSFKFSSTHNSDTWGSGEKIYHPAVLDCLIWHLVFLHDAHS
jgi:hypothetical protein